MSSPYPILDGRPIDQWRVTELKEELKRRQLTTKGLKEELVKRLSRELFSETKTNEDADSGSDYIPKSDLQFEEDEKRSEIVNDGVVASQSEVLSEEGKSKSLVSRTAEAGFESVNDTIHMVDRSPIKEDEGSLRSVDKYAKENVVGSLSTESNHQQAEIFIQELAIVEEEIAVVKEDISVVVSVNQLDLNNGRSPDENTNMEPESRSEIPLESVSEVDKPMVPCADDGDSRSAHPSSSTVSSGPDNQVPEVSLSVGIQVKSDFSVTESGSINEKKELDNNTNAVLGLQVGAEREMVQLSSSTGAIFGMESNHVDVEVVHEKKLLLEEKDGDVAKTMDLIKNQDSGDSGSPEKLNLDRSSGDDSMEEDVLGSKQNSRSDFLAQNVEDMEPSLGREKSNMVAVVNIPLDTEVAEMENENRSAAVSSKRKIHDQSAVDDMTKKQRRMQPDPREQSVNTVAFTKRNDAAHHTVRGGFPKRESSDSGAPKERVVPPSAKPPTNSLRIDRFLRPFTLKAVQDLLGRTGTVVSFWMDDIKTHCFVTFSSVEEAIETRNAVYNLQWPSNGGRLLIADFVDPQEVKARVEGPGPGPGPLKSPMTPTTPAGLRLNFASAQPAGQPQPLPRQQVQRHQLPPPPPLLTNPPPAREKALPIQKQLAPVKEQLIPPPPPVLEKVDPPALTLDDLFRKTRALPRIYYQPLTDEQVAAKLNVEGNNIKQ